MDDDDDDVHNEINDEYLNENKSKRKKRLSINDFMMIKPKVLKETSITKNKMKKKNAKDSSNVRRKSNQITKSNLLSPSTATLIKDKENSSIAFSNHSNNTLHSSIKSQCVGQQQTLISDHFIRKKNDNKVIKSDLQNQNHNQNQNLNQNLNQNNIISNEYQEVNLYYKQEKLSERRKTLDHIPKKENKKVVILDIGKGISKVKGNNKKRVKWKEWNKIIEFKDDTLNKEILFCNED